MITFPFPTVEGLLSDEDKFDLKRLAKFCGGLLGDYVEVGSMNGLSTLCICDGMPINKTLWAYDVNHAANRISENLIASGFNGRVRLITGRCEDTFTGTLPDHLAFAFIDHDHSLVSTQYVYGKIWPRISPLGIMAFHDYQHADYAEPTAFFDGMEHQRLIARPGLIAFLK